MAGHAQYNRNKSLVELELGVEAVSTFTMAPVLPSASGPQRVRGPLLSHSEMLSGLALTEASSDADRDELVGAETNTGMMIMGFTNRADNSGAQSEPDLLGIHWVRA